MNIALDAMGGDHAPRAVVEGAVRAVEETPHTEFTLVGQKEVILAELDHFGTRSPRLHVHHASQVVGMGEKPSMALRRKKDSSMRVGANLVKTGKVAAFVSSGNTGALMATARFVLKTLPGIDRPAIASLVPSITGQTLMLDLGANVDCSVEHLCQFALMGEVFATAVLNIVHPRVGLLNIGEEAVKGNEMVKEAGERLKQTNNKYFIGNVEATEIFQGGVDVVVCDGFVGNILMKFTEGLGGVLGEYLKKHLGQAISAQGAGSIISELWTEMNLPRKMGGPLFGVNGTVILGHGSSKSDGIAGAINTAVRCVDLDLVGGMRQELAEIYQSGALKAS